MRTRREREAEPCSKAELETYVARCKAMIRDAENEREAFWPKYWLKDFTARLRALKAQEVAT